MPPASAAGLDKPTPLQLSDAQLKALEPHLKQFKIYAQSAQYQDDARFRKEKVDFFQREFPAKIPQLSEADLTSLVEHLWAARIWGNQQYLVQQILSANGLDVLKQQLDQLWDTSKSVHRRYDEFLRNVSHLGPAAVTEMLCSIQPTHCGIWNQRAREALKVLGITNVVSPSKYKITGTEYELFNSLLAAIACEIEKLGLSQVDLLLVDYFLFGVGESKGPQRIADTTITSNHDEVCETLAAIGAMLGFDVRTEVTIAAGARVDVVWSSRIGNLGTVTYVFEVQSAGSTDSLILNLQKAKSNPTVQKVVAVSDDVQLGKIQNETEGLPAEFTKALALWRIADVQTVSNHLQSAMGIIEKLGLTPSKT
jgi:hypothetical protein